MKREAVIAKLKSVEPALRAHGGAALYLFGSYARDEAGPDSDLDVFIDKAPGRKFGFDELMGSYHAICDALPDIEISYGTRARRKAVLAMAFWRSGMAKASCIT